MSDENNVCKIDDLEVHKNKKRKKIDEAKRKVLESKMTNIQNPIFQKNLQALFQQDEVLAARLFGMNIQTKYEIVLDKSDPIRINIINIIIFCSVDCQRHYRKIHARQTIWYKHFIDLFFNVS